MMFLGINELRQKIESQVMIHIQSLQIRAYGSGKLILDESFGKNYQYFDLASLTKIFFTTMAIARLCEEQRLNVNDSISKYLNWIPWKDLPVSSLLNHTSGLPWWIPFYTEVELDLESESESESQSDKKFLQLKERLIKLEKSQDSQCVYSDVNFWILGFLIEELYQMNLVEIWNYLFNHLDDTDLHFNINNVSKFSKEKYAPTEHCQWRKKIIQGEVHDDNTWALGGVATHAGLFGSMNGVSQWALNFRHWLKVGGFVSSQIMKSFVQRSIPSELGDFGLGFMLPTFGKASCGRYFSPQSFGHTGFTGTSFWMDPDKDLMIIILSNRTYPDRNKRDFVRLRPVIHDWISQAGGLSGA